jgi:hypothetical protein
MVVGRGLTRAARAIGMSGSVYRRLGNLAGAAAPRRVSDGRRVQWQSEAMDYPEPASAPASAPPRWVRETLGVALAIAVALAVVAVVTASARSELVFRDGDSLVTTLIVRSIAAGQPQDWALSSVLFLPETAALGVLTMVGLGVDGTLALAAVVNIVGLYGAFRFASGAAVEGRAPVAGALAALSGFAVLAMTQTSPDRDALELASLLLTTTYYSATVVAAVLAVGFARRPLEEPGPGRRAWLLIASLAALAAASVLTNPLFAAWATVPLTAVLVATGWAARRRTALWSAGALAAGSAIGFLARMPLAHLIANTGAGYADVTRWADSLTYYGDLVAQRWSSPWGVVASLLLLALWAWCGAATLMLARRREFGAMVVAACGWVMPVVVAGGAILLGTHAARYLQPVEVAPLLGLVVLPSILRAAWKSRRTAPADVTRRRARAIAVAAIPAVALLAAAGAGIPRIAAAASAPDPDTECVVSWVEAAERTGAGQFWTVRLPKAHLDDPRSLVQVDHQLRGYAWLVNRDDFEVGEVSFLVTDALSPAFDLPGDVTMADAEPISCGRYTIHDFGERLLPLGPQRS